MVEETLDVSSVIGPFGRYHFVLVMVTFLRAYPSAWTLTSIDFIAGDVDHWCSPPVREAFSKPYWKAIGVPSFNGKRSKCTRFNVVNGQIFQNITEFCDQWYYDENYPSSAVVEWDLVCSRDWMRSAMQSVSFLGQFVGALIIGRLADRHGRRYMLYVSSASMLVFALLAACSPSVLIFNGLRFLQAMAVSGLQTTSAALYTEICLPKDRNLLNIGFSLGFTIPMIILPFLAYFLDNWRGVQAAAGISTLLLLPCFIFLQESPRWLFSVGRISEAKAAVMNILRLNKRELLDMERNFAAILAKMKTSSAKQDLGFSDIWPHRNLRKNALVLFAFWFLENLFYLASTFLSTRLGTGRFVGYALSAAAELPGGLISIYLIRHARRRRSMSWILFAAAGVSLFTAFMPRNAYYILLALNMVSRTLLVMSTAIKWVYTFELFPTQARSFGFACCYCFGRVGGMIAPFLRILGQWHFSAPYILLATCGLAAGLLLKFTPETVNVDLPDSLAESDSIGRSEKNKSDE